MERPKRSRRQGPALPEHVLRGLASMVHGNEAVVRGMLNADREDDLVSKLAECCTMNQLSVEMLLGRFFDVALLSMYCERVLCNSGKGSASVLAARIAKEWSKPGFTPPKGAESKAVEDDARAKPGVVKSSATTKRSLSGAKRAKDAVAAPSGAKAARGACGGCEQTLEAAVQGALEVVERGEYPVELDSLWLCVESDSATTPSANLLPLVAGVTPTTENASALLKETALYREYKETLVDDRDGDSETCEELLALREQFKTPAMALPALLRAGADDRRVCVWGNWLRGVSWGALEGSFVCPHEVDEVCLKAIPQHQGVLNVMRYHFVHPHDDDFLDSIAMEPVATQSMTAQQAADSFVSSVVCVWNRHERVDVSAAVRQACAAYRAGGKKTA